MRVKQLQQPMDPVHPVAYEAALVQLNLLAQILCLQLKEESAIGEELGLTQQASQPMLKHECKRQDQIPKCSPRSQTLKH